MDHLWLTSIKHCKSSLLYHKLLINIGVHVCVLDSAGNLTQGLAFPRQDQFCLAMLPVLIHFGLLLFFAFAISRLKQIGCQSLCNTSVCTCSRKSELICLFSSFQCWYLGLSLFLLKLTQFFLFSQLSAVPSGLWDIFMRSQRRTNICAWGSHSLLVLLRYFFEVIY